MTAPRKVHGAAFGCWVGTLFAALTSAPLPAQSLPSQLCPDSGLVTFHTDSAGVADVRAHALPLDTVFTISVDRSERRWEAEEFGISAGVSGTGRAEWRACAGASVAVERAATVIENARGTVRIRASLAPLEELRRRHSRPNLERDQP